MRKSSTKIRRKKQKSRVMPGFEKFILYGYKPKRLVQSINTKKINLAFLKIFRIL